ncbi:MAG: CoA transferase, partial [Burkholderiaceae bacterium]|nr:CoA transferase [Burkholderiaceae bacterium]
GEVFGALDAGQVIARLDAAQIANAHINDMHAVWCHPQLEARARWTEVATPAGPIPALLPPGSSDAFAPRMDAVPALGEHTDAILAELGCSHAEIAALRAAGAI